MHPLGVFFNNGGISFYFKTSFNVGSSALVPDYGTILVSVQTLLSFGGIKVS